MTARYDIFKGYGEVGPALDAAQEEDLFDDYCGPDNPNPVTVAFPMSSRNWKLVVAEGAEDLTVESESSEVFVVEYATSGDFIDALARLAGMVEYSIRGRDHG